MEMNNTIRILAEAFDAHSLKYQIVETEKYQEIHVPFGIKNGPFVNLRYISTNNGNDTLVRVMNLINKVPEEKRSSILEVCNTLNGKYRFLKFTMDSDNDVHVEYDFPASTGDEALGNMAFEIFIRTMQILNEGFILLAKALYTQDEPVTGIKLESDGTKDLLKLLKDKHDEINIKISKDSSSEESET